jgi:hypothetical protein
MIRRCLVLALLFITACASHATHPETASGDESAFTPLFNGRDLSGWTYANKIGEGYRVRDGVMYCSKTDGGNVFTEKEFANFVLRLEFKLTPGANNGVGIRAPMGGTIAYSGMEIQILDDTAEQYAHLRPTQYCGSIYDCFPAERGHLQPVGEWNTEEIIANGRHITIKLNGATVVDANLDDLKDPARVAKHTGLKRTSGHVGFLGHGSHVEFRNIRIKEL